MRKLTMPALFLLLVVTIACFSACTVEVVGPSPKEHVVTFDPQNGKSLTTQKVLHGNNALTVDDPIFEGYAFKGWYFGNNEWSFEGCAILQDTLLTAKWEKITYEIVCKINDSPLGNDIIFKYDVETQTTLPVPQREGYAFGGWYENADFSGNVVDVVEKGSYGDKVFYAKWVNTPGGIVYTLSSNSAYYSVTGYDGEDSEIVIAEYHHGLPVTHIGDRAFKSKTRITSVTLPSVLTHIGSEAFYGCYRISAIDLPQRLVSIGSSAFYNCSGLASIEIPDSVTSIGPSAFRGCYSLTSIEIPDSVTSIGSSAFYGCSRLASIVIPEGVTSIGSWAFSDCSSLASIVIPEGVTSIGSSAFV